MPDKIIVTDPVAIAQLRALRQQLGLDRPEPIMTDVDRLVQASLDAADPSKSPALRTAHADLAEELRELIRIKIHNLRKK